MNISDFLGDPTFFKGGIRVVHFIGLALGLGTATFLDLMILRFMLRSNIHRSHAEAFEFGTKVVTAGLVMLWISGLGFLVYYWGFDPEKLGNPKIWAKMCIVGVLTANAVYLHKLVLPLVQMQVSRPLFSGLTLSQRVQMVVGGTTSVTAWYAPVALATIPQFNNSFPANQLWALFCALLLIANAITVGTLFALEGIRLRGQRQDTEGQLLATN